MTAEAPFGSYRPAALAATILALSQNTILGRGSARKALGEVLRKHSSSPLDVKLWGRNARLHLASNYSEMKALLNPASYSRTDFDFVRRTLPRDGVFLDIGANAGMFSLFASSLLGQGGVVLAIEPQPAVFERLRFNMEKANDLDAEGLRIILVQAALGPQSGVAELAVPKELGQASLRVEVGGERIPVPMLPLGELVRAHGLTRIDVMKIDVEGYEDAVLQTFYEKEPRRLYPRAVLMEHCNSERWSWDCIGELAKLGYVETHRDKANIFFTLPD